jgi:hypothetical protein
MRGLIIVQRDAGGEQMACEDAPHMFLLAYDWLGETGSAAAP